MTFWVSVTSVWCLDLYLYRNYSLFTISASGLAMCVLARLYLAEIRTTRPIYAAEAWQKGMIRYKKLRHGRNVIV